MNVEGVRCSNKCFHFKVAYVTRRS